MLTRMLASPRLMLQPVNSFLKCLFWDRTSISLWPVWSHPTAIPIPFPLPGPRPVFSGFTWYGEGTSLLRSASGCNKKQQASIPKNFVNGLILLHLLKWAVRYQGLEHSNSNSRQCNFRAVGFLFLGLTLANVTFIWLESMYRLTNIEATEWKFKICLWTMAWGFFTEYISGELLPWCHCNLYCKYVCM